MARIWCLKVVHGHLFLPCNCYGAMVGISHGLTDIYAHSCMSSIGKKLCSKCMELFFISKIFINLSDFTMFTMLAVIIVSVVHHHFQDL